MPRRPRVDVADHYYHVLNRANEKATLFHDDHDYRFFEKTLEEAVEKFSMRLITYCIMPNHFHLVLYPQKDEDIGKFMHWLTTTHTHRLRTRNHTMDNGHVYQGRYKSFIVDSNEYLQTLLCYVEQNPLRAGIVNDLRKWRWSGFFRRNYAKRLKRELLTLNTVDWSSLNILNPIGEKKLKIISTCTEREIPFANNEWITRKEKELGVQLKPKAHGRPKNVPGTFFGKG